MMLLLFLSSAVPIMSFRSTSTMITTTPTPTFVPGTNEFESTAPHPWPSVSYPVSFRRNRMSTSRIKMVTSVGGSGGGGGLFGEQGTADDQKALRRIQKELPETAQWQIFVDQSKSALDRGGGATLDALSCLAPPSTIQVVPAILPGGNKKGPWVRCISKIPGRSNIEVGNVDSVDKVYRVLTKHLQIKHVNYQVCEALKWKYKGNSLLDGGNTKGAISAYNEALRLLRYTSSPSSSSSSSMEFKQVGTVLLLRSSAYSQQAQFHRDELQRSVDDWDQPSTADLQVVISLAGGMTTNSKEQQLNNSNNRRKNKNQLQQEKKNKIWDTTSTRLDVKNSYSDDSSVVVDGSSNTESSRRNTEIKDGHVDKDAWENHENNLAGGSSLSIALLKKLSDNGTVQKRHLRKIRYLHGLYQNSLLQAVQDSLKATEILPTYSTAWLRSAQLLSDLWKLNESRQYYEKAMTLDDNRNKNDSDKTDDSDDGMVMQSIYKDLDEQQALLDWARNVDGWPEDSVRLALDLSG